MATCFVVMGFGKKTDFETGRTLDLDKSYRNIIRPAVIAAGLDCARADEIPHSGIIDVPMYERLLTADVVVADLSTSNKNAFYELGVRHALRPHTTIVICEDGAKSFPFDVNHVLVRQYHHMGEGIDFDEVQRFRDALTRAICDIITQDPRPKDSPVYTFLNGLTPPALEAAMHAVAKEVAKVSPVAEPAVQTGAEVYSTLMEEVDAAQAEGDFATAKALLTRLRERMKRAAAAAAEQARQNGQKEAKERSEDPYVIQRLALVTYKSKLPSVGDALEQARGLLATLTPEISNDTETLGLWGAVHKRLWEVTGDITRLDEAIRAYERGFYLRNDYYNGINFAYLLNVRAAESMRRANAVEARAERAQFRADAIACVVDAARIRRQVVTICERVLRDDKLPKDDRYWVLATMAEAYLGLADDAGVERATAEAAAVASAPWMKESTTEQMDKLRGLLGDSPIAFISAD